ncbi:hypothetical protein FRC17_000984 [Serendipita sp. 399]|nr:hypothetical protein FRC17_000984 [Serendipita sp. 399]
MAAYIFTVVSLIGSCVKVIAELHELRGRDITIGQTLESIITECSTLEAALAQVKGLGNHKRRDRFKKGTELQISFEKALKGCSVTLEAVSLEIEKLNPGKHPQDNFWTGKMTVTTKVKHLWNEKTMQAFLDQLRGQRAALQLSLLAHAQEPLDAMHNLLARNQSVLNKIHADAMVLRARLMISRRQRFHESLRPIYETENCYTDSIFEEPREEVETSRLNAATFNSTPHRRVHPHSYSFSPLELLGPRETTEAKATLATIASSIASCAKVTSRLHDLADRLGTTGLTLLTECGTIEMALADVKEIVEHQRHDRFDGEPKLRMSFERTLEGCSVALKVFLLEIERLSPMHIARAQYYWDGKMQEFYGHLKGQSRALQLLLQAHAKESLDMMHSLLAENEAFLSGVHADAMTLRRGRENPWDSLGATYETENSYTASIFEEETEEIESSSFNTDISTAYKPVYPRAQSPGSSSQVHPEKSTSKEATAAKDILATIASSKESCDLITAKLCNLADRLGTTGPTLGGILIQCSTIEKALGKVENIVEHRRHDRFDKEPKLRISFERILEACSVALESVLLEIESSNPAYTAQAVYSWNEKTMQAFLELLRGQYGALDLLLHAHDQPSFDMMYILLARNESVLVKIHADTMLLRTRVLRQRARRPLHPVDMTENRSTRSNLGEPRGDSESSELNNSPIWDSRSYSRRALLHSPQLSQPQSHPASPAPTLPIAGPHPIPNPPGPLEANSEARGTTGNPMAFKDEPVATLTGEVQVTSRKVVYDGHYSTVYEGLWNDQKVAIKVIRNAGSLRKTRRVMFFCISHLTEILALDRNSTGNQRFGQNFVIGTSSQCMASAQMINLGNILVDGTGTAKLCDFGLTRLIQEEVDTGMTTTTAHTGTARYLSRELVVEENPMPTTFSDCHALGCVGLHSQVCVPTKPARSSYNQKQRVESDA